MAVTEQDHAEVLSEGIELYADDLAEAVQKLRRIDEDAPEGATSKIAHEIVDLARRVLTAAEEYAL